MLDEPILATTATGVVVVPLTAGPECPTGLNQPGGVSHGDTPRPVRFQMNFR